MQDVNNAVSKKIRIKDTDKEISNSEDIFESFTNLIKRYAKFRKIDNLWDSLKSIATIN